jgi:hypothetical protein
LILYAIIHSDWVGRKIPIGKSQPMPGKWCA